MRIYKDYLFARPSFLEGMARLFDFYGVLNRGDQLYDRSISPAEADARAIRSDWAAIGQDLANAMGTYEVELKEESTSRG